MAQYQPVSWSSNEAATTPKLNQMASNQNWLRQRLVEGRYQAFQLTIATGLKVFATIVSMPEQDTFTVNRNVSFPSGFFSQGCRPIVTATCATTSRTLSNATIGGLGGQISPDHTGVRVRLHNADQNTYLRPQEVHLIVIGW